MSYEAVDTEAGAGTPPAPKSAPVRLVDASEMKVDVGRGYQSQPLLVRRRMAPDSYAMALTLGVSYVSLRGVSVRGSTLPQATVSVLKLVVGVGSFALPAAFAQAGLYGGAGGVLLVAALSAYCVYLYTLAKAKVSPTATYFEVGRAAFGRGMEVTMLIMALIASLGSCAAYMDFMAPTAVTVVGSKQSVITLVMVPLFILLAWIRSFRYLAFTSILGDAAFFIAMATVFVDGFMNQSIDTHQPKFVTDTYPTFFGAAVFLYGITLFISPIQNSMEQPHKFQRAVNFAYGGTALINVAFGILGLMLWGTGVKPIVINSLSGSGYVDAARVFLVCDLALAFPIVLAPGREIVERWLLGPYGTRVRHDALKRNVIRAVLVLAVAGISLSVPFFLDLVGLLSGMALISTSLVFPPLCYMSLHRDEIGLGSKIVNTIIAIFGLIMAVFTTYQAADKIVKHYL